jgi:hypothetical protein
LLVVLRHPAYFHEVLLLLLRRVDRVAGAARMIEKPAPAKAPEDNA